MAAIRLNGEDAIGLADSRTSLAGRRLAWENQTAHSARWVRRVGAVRSLQPRAGLPGGEAPRSYPPERGTPAWS